MLPCCIECPFHAIPAVHLEDRIVLVGTIQAQIVGHYGRGDSAISRGENILVIALLRRNHETLGQHQVRGSLGFIAFLMMLQLEGYAQGSLAQSIDLPALGA